ncbi:flagellar basal-body rod protein FlgG [Permianibacter sp. IMCC34836]|uniref:flagellar basal-body rod protein FlgG n=1 Tax=Permianibacter fluminis TaxID=2738515 RepID=UPI0015527B96|nr:flagellar basal-body rod protein FlgG [Permianibacter fluminis]NQD38067.1 flagellar basal-body rod protein FlgG [Permianibacter fluminis]
MHPALWISKTGLDAQQTDLSVISHNLANASTVGFKKNRAVFEDLLYQNIRQPGAATTQNSTLPTGLMLGTGVKTVANPKQFTQGTTQVTENALDMSIQGRGFFQIQMPDGSTAYTRAGNFQLNQNGEIVTTGEGYLLNPAIAVPTDAQSFTVGLDGTVSVTLQGQAAPTVIGNITLADFINPAGLQPMGDNLFVETLASGAPVVGTPGLTGIGTIRGGSLESSNVNTVEELVNMIETQRAYEMNAKVISTVDQMLQYVSQTL